MASCSCTVVLLAVAVINKSLDEIRLPAAWLREEEALPPPLLPLFPEVWSCGSTLMEMALEKTFSPFTSTLAAGMVYVPGFPAKRI